MRLKERYQRKTKQRKVARVVRLWRSIRRLACVLVLLLVVWPAWVMLSSPTLPSFMTLSSSTSSSSSTKSRSSSSLEAEGPIEGDYPHLIRARIDHDSDGEPKGLWDNPQKHKWMQCVQPPSEQPEPLPKSVGYLQIFLDGGLNQQRIGICNAVAVAKLLNATLLIPEFQINPVWLDSSKFSDIFDEDHFVEALKHDVRVVRQLPKQLAWSTREHYAKGEHGNRVKYAPLHAPAAWYIRHVLPLFRKKKVVAIAPFTHRLAFDGLPPAVQKLRCRVNYHALRFVPAIEGLGQTLVARLRDRHRRHVARGILYGEEGSVGAVAQAGRGAGEGRGEGGQGVAGDMVAYAKLQQQASGKLQQEEEEVQESRQRQQTGDMHAQGQGYSGESAQGRRSLLLMREREGEEGGRAGVDEEGVSGRGIMELWDERDVRVAGPHRRLHRWWGFGSSRQQRQQQDTGPQRYVALHLRYDKDMVAHSACDYGETAAEKEALARYRQYAWLGRVDKLRYSSADLRRQGKCPLTPEEAGLFLAALGFSRDTPLYVATYQVYGGARRIAPLRRLFPRLEDKTSLATADELAPLLGKASHLAALDFYVAFHSDVFVSASAGNMHNMMAGHRAFFGGLRTVEVNMTLIAQLLLAAGQRSKPAASSATTTASESHSASRSTPGNLGTTGSQAHTHTRTGTDWDAATAAADDAVWVQMCQAVQRGHRSRVGRIKMRKPKQSIYTYPAPDCLCPVPEREGALPPQQQQQQHDQQEQKVNQ